MLGILYTMAETGGFVNEEETVQTLLYIFFTISFPFMRMCSTLSDYLFMLFKLFLKMFFTWKNIKLFLSVSLTDEDLICQKNNIAGRSSLNKAQEITSM
jgi:hypothetical protein